jgi:hypothetical protein
MSPEDFLQLLAEVPAKLDAMPMRDPLKQASYEVGEQVGQNFQRQVGADGSPWPSHAPMTVALHGEHPLLKLTYAMYDAATDPDDPSGKLLLEDRQITFGIDGTEIPYAQLQNEGGAGESGNRIPQREFFYLTEQGAEDVHDTFADAAGPLVETVLFG